MSDYIEREDAIDMVCEFGTDMERHGKTLLTMVDVKYLFINILETLPSADVAPVRHGYWIKISPAGIYECSECGKNVMTSDIEAYEYCHGCGSRMDGENNE